MTIVYDFGSSRASTASDYIASFLYAAVGLHTGFEKKLSLQIVTSAIWLIIHIWGMLAIAKCWHEPLLESGTDCYSLVAVFAGVCVYIGSIIYSSIRIMCNHDEIELLLRRNGRPPMLLLLQAACTAPFVLIGIRKARSAKDTDIVLNETYFFLVHLSVMIFFLISSEVVFNLKTDHDKLLSLTANIGARHEQIRYLRWDRIRRINRIFSWSWGSHYALIFNTAIFLIFEVIDGSLSFVDDVIIFLAAVCFLYRLYDLAQGSSTLKESCLKIEGRLLGQGRRNGIDKGIAESLLPAIAYREELDILRNGCFPLESGKFFSFLATSVTCTAVILQFDHHVLRNLAQASAVSQSPGVRYACTPIPTEDINRAC